MKVLGLTRYSRQGASSRLRSLQYFPALAAAGISVEHRPLFDDAYLQRLYARQPTGRLQAAALLRRMALLWRLKRSDCDVLWLEKELLPWLPWLLEAALLPSGVPLLIDYDDAIFHNYDQHRLPLVRAVLGHKIDRLMRRADLVVGGSPYLVERARAAGARRVEYIPTVVDLERYPVPATREPGPLRVGWMGTPMTAHFLQPLLPVLQQVHAIEPFELLIVGGAVEVPGVPVTVLPWSEAGEAAAIARMDIGLMPLNDSPWERGKCGYKLIQYMACGRPVLASPVGVNRQLVEDGVNGFCAATPEQWQQRLLLLLRDGSLRQRCGEAARARVEQQYCLQRTAPRLVDLLQQLGRGL